MLPAAPSILLTPAVLAGLRQQAAANTPQWQAYETMLNQGLLQIIPSGGAYQASELTGIEQYALGYQVLMNLDPTTANAYADKAIAMIKSGLNDYQKSVWYAEQYLARGDGVTTTFTLPDTAIVSSTVQVSLSPVTTQAVVHSSLNGQDAVNWYEQFIKVSNTSDGNAAYTKGVDWQVNGSDQENLIDWSLGSANQPAVGATYYVTMSSRQTLNVVLNYTLHGNQITFTTPPPADQAIFVQYVYGTHAGDGSSLAYQQTSAGDGAFNSIFVDTAYTSRYLGKELSIGLDWLDGYVGMTPTLQSQTEAMLTRWYNYLQQNGYNYTSIESNYGAGSYVSNVFTALALNQRTPQGPAMLTQMVSFRQQQVVPDLSNPTNSLFGGFWAEGWNYGQLAAENVLLAGMALDRSGAISSAAVESQWAAQVTMDLTSAQPTRSTLYDGGDWYAFPAPFPGKDLFDVLSAVDTNSTTQAYDNYILQNYPGSNGPDLQSMLFWNPSAPATFWAAAPLQDFASGTGLLTARSNWSTNSVWVSLQMGNLLGADHQTYEPGQLQIQQGGDDLLVGVNALTGNQWPKPAYGNTVMVSDNGVGAQTYLWGPGYWYGSGVVTKAYEATSNYVYDYGDMSTIYSPAYSPGSGGSVSLLTRQLVYLRPNLIVVYDRVTTVQPNFPKHLDWNFINAPVVNGNSFTETVGQSELLGATFSIDPLSTAASAFNLNGVNVNEIITQDTLQKNSVQYVTAFEVAGAGTSSMVGTQQIVTTDGRMQGVEMGSNIVLFGRSGAMDLSTPISYQANGSSALSNLLTNLVPGQSYEVSVDGVGTTTATASSQGTLNFTTPGGTHTIEVGNTGSTIGLVTHFLISGPTSATAGGSFSAAVDAVDAHNNIVTGYSGAVFFTSSDTNAGLISNYTFTSADAGAHTFTFTLNTAGSQTIFATDTVNSSLTGSTTITVNPGAKAAASLALTASQSVTAGSTFSFTVTARATDGTTATGYRGTVALSSSDPSATLPATYTFTAGDAGVHVFTNAAIFDKAGAQTLSVSDTVLGTLKATASVGVLPAAASRLSVSAAATVAAGGPLPVTVAAFDAFGNVATGYAGTVHFSSSDSNATLPAAYTFTSADAGSHTFSLTLKTAGSQTAAATDNSSLAGSATVMVSPAAATRLSLTVPSSATAGAAFSITVSAFDALGNVATGYSGTVSFSSSDATATLPANYTFTATDRGRRSFQVTLKHAGSETVTVSDVASGALKGQMTVSVGRKIKSSGPTAQTTTLNTALVFSTATGNALTVDDGVGVEAIHVVLTATDGILSLATTNGLTFTRGSGSNSANMIFTGTMASINAALNGLTFKPANGYVGNANLVVSTADPLANSAPVSTVVGITVIVPQSRQNTMVSVKEGASTALFALAPEGALYEHEDATGWVKLGNYIQSISGVAASDGHSSASSPVLFAVTTDHALARFDGRLGWSMLGAPGTVASVSAGTDATGRPDAFVLTMDGSLVEYRDSSGWNRPIGGRGSVQTMRAGSNDRVVVITADQSIFAHDDTFGWYRLSGSGFARSISLVTETSGNQVLFAQTLSGSLFRFDQNGWSELGAWIASISAGLAVDGRADVFATTQSNDIATWQGGVSSILPRPSSFIVAMSAAGSGEIFVTCADGSIQEYDPSFGWMPWTSSGFAAL